MVYEENLRKWIGERLGNKKIKRNRASKFATMEEALLGFVRQAIDRNLPLTREIINTKVIEFAENWVMAWLLKLDARFIAENRNGSDYNLDFCPL
jgi:hypothetical protein